MRCRYDLVIAKQLNNELNLLILFIISKIKNERFDEEEIKKLTSKLEGQGWRRAGRMGASWCVCQTATHNASVVCLPGIFYIHSIDR